MEELEKLTGKGIKPDLTDKKLVNLNRLFTIMIVYNACIQITRLQEYIGKGYYGILAYQWAFTLIGIVNILIFMKGYLKEHRKLLFVILF